MPLFNGTTNDDLLAGTDGNDTLDGQEGNDTLQGLGGDDVFDGGAGADWMSGGDGNDSFGQEGQYGGFQSYADDLDSIDGGAGDDSVLYWNSGASSGGRIDGGTGNDTLKILWSNGLLLLGGDGNDTLTGSLGGGSTADAGAGNDVLSLGLDNSVISAGEGNDKAIVSGPGTIRGGAGDDTITAWGDTTVIGGQGRDTFELYSSYAHVIGSAPRIADFKAGAGGDLIDLGPILGGMVDRGYDYSNPFTSGWLALTAVNGNTYININTGTPSAPGPWLTLAILYNVAPETLVAANFVKGIDPLGSTTPVKRTGGDGDDTLYGGDLSDTLLGGGGHDSIEGGYGGDDSLLGGTGNDTLSGLGGNDVLLGEEGVDYIHGDAGNDIILGGDGNDGDLNYGDSGLHGDVGDDTIGGGAGNDLLHGGEGNDSLIGGSGDDLLFGDGGVDVVRGGDGNDTFGGINGGFGSSGGDSIFGDAGQDVIHYTDSWIGGYLHGGADDDYLEATGGAASTLLGGAGNDTLMGGYAAENLIMAGGDGDDTFRRDSGATGGWTVNGGMGNDDIVLTGNDMWLNGGAGDDTISLGSGNGTIIGGEGSDVIALSASMVYYAAGSTMLVKDFATGPGGDRLDLSHILGALNRQWGYDYDNPFTSGWLQLASEGSSAVLQIRVGGPGVDGQWLTVAIFENVDPAAFVAENFTGNLDPHGNAIALLLDGTDGKDSLIGAEGDDVLSGNAGDDVLDGGFGGADTLLGGLGRDALFGFGGNDSLSGGDEQDNIVGGSGDDVINGGAGDDSLQGASYKGVTSGYGLEGGTGNDTVDGGEGNDIVDGGSGDDLLYGGDGNDILIGGAGNDVIEAGAGNDTIAAILNGSLGYYYSGTGADTIRGEEGDDYIAHNGTVGASYLDGGIGADTLIASGSFVSVNGAEGNDSIFVSMDYGTVDGGDGDDRIDVGNASSATVFSGGAGNDTLDAQTSYGYNNTLEGGSGDDLFLLGAHFNPSLLTTGEGRDTIRVNFNGGPVVIDFTTGAGGDLLDLDGVLGRLAGYDDDQHPFVDGWLRLQADGPNTVLQHLSDGNWATLLTLNNTQPGDFTADNFAGGIDPLGNVTPMVLEGGAGNDTLTGQGGSDLLSGQDGDDVLEGGYGGADTLLGGAGRDLLNGGRDNDSLEGGADADTLMGGDGDDLLLGGEGDDELVAGPGRDTLSGGNGRDDLHALGGSGVLLDGGDGGDTFYLQEFNDLTVIGGAGNDTVWASTTQGIIEIDMGEGDDAVYLSGSSQATIDGGIGNDTIQISGGNHVINAGDGDDRIILQQEGSWTFGSAHVTTGSGRDTVTLAIGTAYDGFAPSVISDFTVGAGGDLLDMAAVLDRLQRATGMPADSDPFADGYLRLTGSGSDTVLEALLTDGLGVTGYVPLAVFEGVAPGALTADNFMQNLIPVFTGNQVPIAPAYLEIQAQEDSAVVFDLPVLVDPDGGPLTVTVGQMPVAGTINLADGSSLWVGRVVSLSDMAGLTFIPAADYAGSATAQHDFVYTVTDDEGSSVTGRVGFEVLPVNDAPTLQSAGFTYSDDGVTPLVLDLTSVVTDADHANSELSFSVDTQSLPSWLVYDAETLTLSGIAPAGTMDSYAITVTVTDPLGASNTVSLPLTLGGMTLTGSWADDTLSGGSGSDQIYGVDGNDLLSGGSGNDSLWGNGGQDSLYGGSGDDYLVAEDDWTWGNNTLDGGAGADTMIGGVYNDTFFVDDAGDVVIDNGYYTDSIVSSISYSLEGLSTIENLTLSGNADVNATGNSGDNTLTGNSGNNVLDTGGGTDALVGGAGDDTYIIRENGGYYSYYSSSVSEMAAEGNDSVFSYQNFQLGENVEYLALMGSSAINGFGNQQDNLILGNEVGNLLQGNDGNDTLDGGLGNDTLSGDYGDDLIIGGEGDDELYASIGTDTLQGGAGNDTISMDSPYSWSNGSAVISGGEGSDTIRLSWTSSQEGMAAPIVTDFTAGDGGDRLDLANIINQLEYQGLPYGSDPFAEGWLRLSNTGEDTLLEVRIYDYWSGSTRYATLAVLQGLADASTLTSANFVQAVSPVAVNNELPAVDPYKVLSGDEDSWISLALSAPIDADGGTVTITVEQVPASGMLLLPMGGGNWESVWQGRVLTAEQLTSLMFVPNNDFAGGPQAEFEFRYKVTDEEGSSIVGRVGFDVQPVNDTPSVSGQAVTCNLEGDASFSIRLRDFASDVDNAVDELGISIDTSTLQPWMSYDPETTMVSGVVPQGEAGVYSIGFSVSDPDGASVSGSVQLVPGVFPVYGSWYDDTLQGGSGNSELYGFDGNDQLAGGAGGDTLYGGWGQDSLYGETGADLLWGEYGEDVLAGGDGDDTLYGGEGRDTLAGGAGNDRLYADSIYNFWAYDGGVLDGGAGADTMTGSYLSDIYIVDDSGDQVVDDSSSYHRDTVISSISYSLAGNMLLEDLQLSGESAISGAGNDSNNVLTGNAADNGFDGGRGNDTIDGGAGADTLVGGLGDDRFLVDSSGDVVLESANEGIDTIESSVSLFVAAHVENVVLTGASAINAGGNALDNYMQGNAGNNGLHGADGNDTLDGGAGNDTLLGAAGNDVYVFGPGFGSDVIVENDATAGNSDRVEFGAGISADQLWFARQGSHLQVSVVGSSDVLYIKDWFTGSQHHVEQFVSADGQVLLDSQVDALVSAMAGFAVPAAAHSSVVPAVGDAVAPLLASSWH